MKVLSMLFLALLITGCAPHSAMGVRESAIKKVVTFTVDENYLNLYSRLLAQTKECDNAWIITASRVADGDLDIKQKTGTITVSIKGGLGNQYHKVIDIKETEINKSVVNAFYAVGPVEKQAALLKKWIYEDYRSCSI